MRRAAKVDSTSKAIVDDLRAAGFLVWHIGFPVDLLVFKAGVFRCLELKTPKNKRGDPRQDKRQVAQAEFIAQTGCPVVCDSIAALKALGAFGPLP